MLEKLNKSSEGLLLVWLEPVRLDKSIIAEVPTPFLKRGSTSVKDEIVPLLPDIPSYNSEDFHEEMRMIGLLGSGKRSEEVCVIIPLNTNMVPAFLTEGAVKK